LQLNFEQLVSELKIARVFIPLNTIENVFVIVTDDDDWLVSTQIETIARIEGRSIEGYFFHGFTNLDWDWERHIEPVEQRYIDYVRVQYGKFFEGKLVDRDWPKQRRLMKGE